MSLFSVDFNKLVKQYLPTQLIKSPLMGFVAGMIKPLLELAPQLSGYRYGGYRGENIYRLTHNSQVVRMEAVLNDAFDDILRRITISDSAEIDSTYIYLRAELKPRYIYRSSEAPQTTYIRLTGETVLGGLDFIVNVPIAIVFDKFRMCALINDYRLASKSNYLINII